MTYHVHQFVVNMGSVGVEESGSRRKVVEMEKTLLFSDSLVASLCCFFMDMYPLV